MYTWPPSLHLNIIKFKTDVQSDILRHDITDGQTRPSYILTGCMKKGRLIDNKENYRKYRLTSVYKTKVIVVKQIH